MRVRVVLIVPSWMLFIVVRILSLCLIAERVSVLLWMLVDWLCNGTLLRGRE